MGIFQLVKENKLNIKSLPDVMYFSSPNKINELKGKVFLSPLIGISSMFIIDKKDIKSTKNASCNIGYKEWNYSDNKLKQPLSFVHVTHNIKERTNIEKGSSSGYIYIINISKIKDKLSLFITNDSSREVIYNGEEPLNIIEVIPWNLKWTCEYDEENAKQHGYGILKESTIIQEQVLLESANSERKYKCPYCNYRDTREGLVYHVDDKHQDQLPKGYSPARVIFNYFNKKDHGTCIMCKQITTFDEEHWRYFRICNKPKCKKEYNKMIDERMIKMHGDRKFTNNVDNQKKMLANRKISGEYKFKDSGIRTYCGSYENKLLEFLDKTFGFKSSDIDTPGPIIEYEYQGKKLQWITDDYIIPYNLVLDVKDGGSNPNNRPMEDYRAKQLAKENAISKLGKYNYLRLTDNNFEQLLLIMAQIKKQLTDTPDKDDVIISINESLLLESIKNNKLPIFKTPNEFNEYLNTFNYGLIINGKPKINNLKLEEYNKYYRLLSPQQFFKYKTGICWDYVEFERYYFTNYFNYKFNTYFIELLDDKDKGTHTILIYQDNNKFYYFESSFAIYKGIYEFNSEEEILNFVIKNMNNHIKQNSRYSIYKYNNVYKYGCNEKEYIKYIRNNGEKININEDLNVNEYTALAGMNPMINNQQDTYIIPYSMNNSFIGTCISTNKYFDSIYRVKDKKIVKENISFLFDYDFSIYRYKGNNSINDLLNEEVNLNNKDFFYASLTGKELIDIDQISFDESFEEVANPFEEKVDNIKSIIESINHQYNKLTNNDLSLPILDSKLIDIKNNILEGHDGLDIKQDIDGYFVYNETTLNRSKSYEDLRDIPNYSIYDLL